MCSPFLCVFTLSIVSAKILGPNRQSIPHQIQRTY
jgi:hypothetical protein